jgi:acyl-CoA dehydrogenase
MTAPAPPDFTQSTQRIDAVRHIAREVAAPASRLVDRDARFPIEAIDALRKARLLSAYVPPALGGHGSSVEELATMCRLLGEACASTAMVFAMHQIQVACLVRHGAGSTFIESYLRNAVERQLLIASVTTEAGVGGSTRTSISPIERDGGGCRLRKDGTVVSYCDDADDLLITVRRAPDAAPSDQAMVLASKSQCVIERAGTWDAFGMRGTCSPGYVITARFGEEQIVPAAFADISAQTMVPFAHILWSCCWLGIAEDAVARARAFVRSLARQTPGVTPPAASRLSEASTMLHTMRALVGDMVHRYERLIAQPDGGAAELSSIAFAIPINELKLGTSRLVVDIVSQALRVCGVAGYRNDSPYSVTRHLRDAHSAALMISNDRINAANGALHLVYKDREV